MKIYTKTGDQGTTGLIGVRVEKNHMQVELYGQLDEIVSMIGYGRAKLLRHKELSKECQFLIEIQKKLMELSSELANKDIIVSSKFEKIYTTILEQEIDTYATIYKPINQFIIPGATEESGWIDYLRAKVRSVERQFVTNSRNFPQLAGYFTFLNRLSDYFYSLARLINHKLNQDEILYK